MTVENEYIRNEQKSYTYKIILVQVFQIISILVSVSFVVIIYIISQF